MGGELPLKCQVVSENRHDASTLSRLHKGGSRIERHRHDEHQIVYPSSGVVAVHTDAGSWVAPTNRAIWIPAGQWHEHHFFGATQFHCVVFDPADHGPGLRSPSVVTVSPLLRELIVAASVPEAHAPDELARLRTVLLDQLRHSPEQALKLPSPSDIRLNDACAVVQEDLSRAWPLAELGRRVGASERTLSRLYRDEMGMTYPQWRTQVRLYRALQLLAENEPVTHVAYRCGWSSPSAFIEVFRHTLGYTPGRATRAA